MLENLLLALQFHAAAAMLLPAVPAADDLLLLLLLLLLRCTNTWPSGQAHMHST
jgi:hypothetical protein